MMHQLTEPSEFLKVLYSWRRPTMRPRLMRVRSAVNERNCALFLT